MHPGNWHQIGNHTPNDPDGYMMVINASDNPSVFYEAPVPNLCPNTTYQFAAWLINLLTYSGKKPNLTFTIVTEQETFTYNTGDIAEGSATDWLQRGFLFKTPSDVNNIIIRIRNNGPGGTGNDIAIDDITFSPCGPVIIPSIDNAVTPSKTICVGDTRDLLLSAEVTSGVYTNTEYLWQELDVNGIWQDLPAETTNHFTKHFNNALVGRYKYRLLVAEQGNINSPNCRANSPEFELNVVPLPIPIVNTPLAVCIGAPINLSVNEASTYKWTGPNNFNSEERSPIIPNATADMAGTYNITISNDAGCQASAQVEVTIIPGPTARIDAIVPICKGTSVALNASGGIAYRWLPATGLSATDIPDPVATPTETTTYTVFVSNGLCESQAQVTVNVIKELLADAGADQKIIKGNSAKLNGQAMGENIDRTFWTPAIYLDDPTKLNPIASPAVSTTYTLNIVSSSGCISRSDEVFVKVYDKLIVPSAFSPNGDGINDLWNIVAIDTYTKPKVKVMNRYGQLVFEGSGNEIAWNGKRGQEEVPVGVYYYMIYLEPGLKPLSGSLMVIR